MTTFFDTQLPIAIGADHAGFEYKLQIIDWLQHSNLLVQDFGTFNTDAVDYANFAHPVANGVENNENAFGILFCGSANGVAITANKHKDIRAGLCWNNEVAKLVRQHNNANIICIPARFVTLELAIDMINIFMQTEFEGGRHQTRIDKINC